MHDAAQRYLSRRSIVLLLVFIWTCYSGKNVLNCDELEFETLRSEAIVK